MLYDIRRDGETEQGAHNGSVLSYLQEAYDARNSQPIYRAELLQMQRVAHYFTENSEAPLKNSQEFFCGELLGAEFIARLAGTPDDTGSLAQDAWAGFLEISRPEGEIAESLVQLATRHNSLIEELGEKLGDPTKGLLPPEYESLLDSLVFEKELRTAPATIDEQYLNALYPRHFAMGFRMVVNEALNAGFITVAHRALTTDPEDETRRAVAEAFYGMPAREHIIDSVQVPTDDELKQILGDDPESNYFLMDDTCQNIRDQHDLILSRLRALTKIPASYDEQSIEAFSRRAQKVLSIYIREKNLLNQDDLLTAVGNQWVFIQTEGQEPQRFYINANHEIRGQYSDIDVISMPPNQTLKKMLRKGSDIDPNDPAHHTLFVPALRLKNPTVTQLNDNGAYEGALGLGDDIEVSIPLIYDDVFIAKFLSTLQEDLEA